MPETLYLIDGHALAYRAFFALIASGSRFQTRSGEPTAGIYGFTNILLRILEQEKPKYLAVAFDTGKTFRNETYPQYKATRAKMPEDLVPQIVRIRQVVDAFNIPRLEKEGYEADDVLGTIARQAVAKGLGVKIITGDRDLLQLVDERIVVNLSGKKLTDAEDYTSAKVKQEFGVRPDQVVDYKALIGDKSDNIPGVHGIGEKTALTILEKHPTLEEVYAHLEDYPERIRKLLEQGKQDAYLSYDLSRIRTDLPITLDLEQAKVGEFHYSELVELFKELEFRSLLSRLQTPASVLPGQPSVGQPSLFSQAPIRIGTSPRYSINTILVDSAQKLADLQQILASAKVISFDTETTSTDPMQADLVGVSLAVKEGEGYYVPVGHVGGQSNLALKQVVDALRPALTDFRIQKTGHNIKYDALVLHCHGLDPSPLSFDTMLAAWLIDPASRRLGLKDMAELELDASMTHIEELIGTGRNQRSMAEVAITDVAPYAAADSEITLRLQPILAKRMKDLNVLKVFEEMEMPLVSVLEQMEFTGISLDAPLFKKLSAEFKIRLTEIENQVFAAVGYPFNLNSTQQLSRALFETLRLVPPDAGNKTKSGHYSTSASVLEDLRGKHPVVDQLLEFRELSKLVSTYLDAMPLQINPRTGRVHTSFNQTGTVTGRLASSDPNLQNIPTRTETGHQVRKGFIASPGQVLLSVDYSQIELRIVAHMSGDQAMLDAFRAGQDIHVTTAAAIYDVPLDQVSKEQRRHAKAINFGLIYGMSAFGLAAGTDLTLAEAENFVRDYFIHFPRVKEYLDGIRRLAAQQGYVETLLGRRRYFPNLKNPPTAQIRVREEREAINAPIQGTAADILKIAMIRLPSALSKAGLEACLLLQVHDELLLECPKNELKETGHVVREVMENAYQLSIPLLADAAWGTNWGELQPLD
jgi:DNA polymerase-1